MPPTSIREVLGVKANAKLPSNASRACRLDAHSFFRCFSASPSGRREIGIWLLFAPKSTPIAPTKYILEIANVVCNNRSEKNRNYSNYRQTSSYAQSLFLSSDNINTFLLPIHFLSSIKRAKKFSQMQKN